MSTPQNRFMHSIITRIGRRGLVLVLLSAVYAIIGLKVVFTPALNMHGEFNIYNEIPPIVRAAGWFIAAACGFSAAILRRGQNDSVGFGALGVPVTIVTGSYLVSWVGWLLGLNGSPLGWLDALEWGTILALLLITAGWEEVDHDITYVKLVEKEAA